MGVNWSRRSVAYVHKYVASVDWFEVFLMGLLMMHVRFADDREEIFSPFVNTL